MVVTRRVPSPRSLRHLLQVASVSASVVGKRESCTSSMDGARPRVRVRRDESLLCWALGCGASNKQHTVHPFTHSAGDTF